MNAEQRAEQLRDQEAAARRRLGASLRRALKKYAADSGLGGKVSSVQWTETPIAPDAVACDDARVNVRLIDSADRVVRTARVEVVP